MSGFKKKISGVTKKDIVSTSDREKRNSVDRKNITRQENESAIISDVKLKFNCVISQGAGAGLPVTCDIYNVMGQEDLFRQEGGERVLNYARGRIVFTTGVPTIAKILYSANDLDLDIDTGILNPDEPKLYHEWFLEDLNVDSLYGFKIIATPTNIEGNESDFEEVCPDDIESGIYYFTIGGIVTQADNNLMMIPTIVEVTFDEIFSKEITIEVEIIIPTDLIEEELFIIVQEMVELVPDHLIEEETTEGYIYNSDTVTIL